jgi:hypothetical protein
MEMLTKQPTTKGPDTMFTGDVWFDVIVRGEPPSRVRTNTVRFSPGARTAWHSHAVGQTLYVTEGIGLVQARGGNPPLAEWIMSDRSIPFAERADRKHPYRLAPKLGNRLPRSPADKSAAGGALRGCPLGHRRHP